MPRLPTGRGTESGLGTTSTASATPGTDTNDPSTRDADDDDVRVHSSDQLPLTPPIEKHRVTPDQVGIRPT